MGLACLLAAGLVLTAAWNWRLGRLREARFQATLNDYSSRFHTGMKRGEIEAELRVDGVAYRQMNGTADTILIEKLGSDLVCANKAEYLALHFDPSLHGKLGEPQPDDTLTKIDLKFDGICL
jgi:hypothetical protein